MAIPVFLGLRNRYGFRKGVVMTDAAQFIDALGGTNKVANALALAPTTVSSWKSSGSIPEWRMDKLKRLARKAKVEVPVQFLDRSAA